MKRWMLLGLLLTLCGCNEADVLSTDGATLHAHCNCFNWVKCVSVACPNGYTVVANNDSQGIIKCKADPVPKDKQ